MISKTVPKQTYEAAPRKQGGEAISSISVQSETVCETNTQCKNTKRKNPQETIWLLKKEISDKDKTISKKDKTIEKWPNENRKWRSLTPNRTRK